MDNNKEYLDRESDDESTTNTLENAIKSRSNELLEELEELVVALPAKTQEPPKKGLVVENTSSQENGGQMISSDDSKELEVVNKRFSYSPSITSATNSLSLYLSPYSSSNTLTGSMVTASEGMRSPGSGMTQLSKNSVFMTPNTMSFQSFKSAPSSLEGIKFYSCHSNLRFLLENDENENLENVLNEEKLKHIHEMDNLKPELVPKKDNIIKGIYRRLSSGKRKHDAKMKYANDTNDAPTINNKQRKQAQLVVETHPSNNDQPTTKVLHGILKSSVSSDSSTCKYSNSDNNSMPWKQREMSPPTIKGNAASTIGGTKAMLVEKVKHLHIIFPHLQSSLFALPSY